MEFAVVNRFHRAMAFPRVQGFARRRGARVRWLRFAVPADDSLRLGCDGASLLPEDQTVLRGWIRRFDPTHLIFSHRPAAELGPGAGAQDRRGGYLAEAGLASGGGATGPFSPLAGEAGVGPFLGFPASTSLEAETPDYSWTPGNRGAETLEPLPFVRVDAECRYNRSLAHNPFFAGVDLSGSLRPGGCSFCLRPSTGTERAEDLETLLERQLSAIERTCPRRPGRRLAIRLTGERAMGRIDEVAALIARLKLRPADFLLDSRVDVIVRTRERFERALGRLRGTGHRLALALVGIENFASGELRRYNKGASPVQNLEAARMLFEWEALHPETFGFREFGGLSMITFNPWTRPEEFDLNVSVAELAGLAPMLGKLWNGRLRLYPGLALEAKARQEGLLVARCDDPLLETARLNFYENETPWRFQAPEMESVNRITARFFSEGPPPTDELSVSVSAFLKEGTSIGVSPAEAAHLAVLAAQRAAWEGGPADPGDALARARRLAGAHPRLNTENVRWFRPDGLSHEEALKLLERKPVVKIEPIHSDDLAAWRARGDLPHARFYRRAWGRDGRSSTWELIFGRDPGKVRRAVELTRREAASAGPQGRAATEGVGVLLGYPRCCARAHSRKSPALRHRDFWGHVLNRISAADRVPPELNPGLHAVVHVPCSLACPHSLAQARRALAAGRRPGGGRNPYLLLWGADDCWVELKPRTGPGPRFAYDAGGFSGMGADLDAAREGDEIELGEETVLIRKQGRPYASLSGRAFLWWHRRVFQGEFWRGLAALSASVPHPETRPVLRRGGPPPKGRPVSGLESGPGRAAAAGIDIPEIARLLAAADAECAGGPPGVFESRFDGDVIRIRFDGKEFGLFLAPRQNYRGPFFGETPSFYACVRGDLAMTPSEKERLESYVKALARRDGKLKEIFRGAGAPDGQR